MNLEENISEWRKQMLAAGIQSPVPLEELEIHLREEIQREIKSGSCLDEREAFNFAIQKIGQPQAIKIEFKKIERNIMKQRIIIGLGIFVVLFGTAMILPALGKHKQRNHEALSGGSDFYSVKWAADEKYGLALGSAVAIAGIGTTFYGFKRRKA